MSSYPRRKGELIQSASAEGWTVYEPDTDSLHALNESARAIWELCDGATSPDEMAVAVAELTGLEPREAALQVANALAALSELGLIDDSAT